MVTMSAEMLFKQFYEFSGYVRFDITVEWWIEPYNVPGSIFPGFAFLMFVLLELDFLLISTVS